jgi:MFS family permease
MSLVWNTATRLREFFGLKRNVVILLLAIIVIGAGEELWMRFVPKYLQALGAVPLVIGLYDGIKTLLGAIYAWPGGIVADRFGHRHALMAFNVVSIVGYAVVLLVPHWGAVLAGTFLFLAWSCFSLPATFSLIGAALHEQKHAMGIGVQSVIKRLPIIVGPICGGVLIDRFGILTGVRIALVVTITLGIAAIFLQRRLGEEKSENPFRAIRLWRVLRDFPPPLRRLLMSDILIRFCERVPYAWVVIYAMDDVGMTATQIGVLTAIEIVTSVLCLIPAAYLADKYGREPFVIVTFVFFTAFPLVLLAAQDFAWLTVAFATRGLKEFGEPARKALIIGHAPAMAHARTIGAYYLIRDLIVTSGAFIGAGLWKIGPTVNFCSAAAIGAFGTIFYAFTYLRRVARE